MNSEEQRILDIKVRYEDAVNGIASYQKKIDELSKAEEKLKKQYKDGQVTRDEYRKQTAAIREVTKEYKDDIRVLSKEIQNNLKTEKEQEGSLKSLRAQLSNVTKAYDALSRAERNGAKGQEMAKHINQITKELKDAEYQTQRFYRNVGNYKESIMAAIAGNNGFAKSLMSLAGGSGGGMAGGVAMGAAGVAAAGIGALVAGIYTLKGVMSSAVDLIVDFEKSNSNLAAVLGTTADKIKDLKDDALRLGEQTRYTASEVTQLQTELAKLGFSKTEIKDSTEMVLMFANATGADLASAAQVAGAALRAFGDDAQNMGRYVSSMAVGTTKSALSFGDLSTALSTLAPVAHAFGFEIEDVVTLVGKLKDSGFDASSAATAARNILLNLADANGKLAKSMGGPVKDMEGLKKGLIGLRDSGIDLASALELTDKRSVAAFEAFMTNAEGLTEMREAVTGCEDGLRAMDEEMANNVNGSLKKLESAWQGLLLKFYNSKGVMKGVVDRLTEFVSWCSKLGERFQSLKERSLLVRAAWNGFVGALKTGLQALGSAAKAILSIVKGIGKAFEGLLTLDFSRMYDGLKEATLALPKMAMEVGRNTGKNLVDSIKKTIKKEKNPKVEVDVEVSGDSEVAETANGSGGKKYKAPMDEKAQKAAKAAAEKAQKEQAERNKKEMEEIQKAEQLLTEIIVDNVEQRKKAIAQKYDQQIETLRRRLQDEKNLTEEAQRAMTSQMESLVVIRDQKLKELDMKFINERIQRETKNIEMILSTVRKGSEQEYQLKLQKIQNEQELALNTAEVAQVTEEEKQRNIWAIKQKYAKMFDELENQRTQSEVEAIKKRYQEQILAVETSEDEMRDVEKLRLEMEQRQEILNSAHQMEGESIQEFNIRKLQLEKDYQSSKQALNDKEVEIEQAKYEAIGSLMGGLSDVAEAFGEENEGLAKMAKFFALGEIAVNTGKAISAGVASASSLPFPANLAAIATTVATVLSNVATAIKTVKSAKFADGGLVVGDGTGTSDSISAKLSNGESVLTARATKMFAPALSAFNQMGGGVPISTQAGGSQVGEEFLANAVAKGMAAAPRPVVAVEEINKVQNRLNMINQISVIE